MLRKNKLNNYKMLILKKKFIKNEIKKIILKSIIYNQKVIPQLRAYAQWKQTTLHFQHTLTKQKNTCVQTGKFKSIINSINRSRHICKTKALTNSLTNINLKTW